MGKRGTYLTTRGLWNLSSPVARREENWPGGAESPPVFEVCVVTGTHPPSRRSDKVGPPPPRSQEPDTRGLRWWWCGGAWPVAANGRY